MMASSVTRCSWRGSVALAIGVMAATLVTDAGAQKRDKGAKPPEAQQPDSRREPQKSRPEDDKSRARPVDPEGCPLDGERKLEMIV